MAAPVQQVNAHTVVLQPSQRGAGSIVTLQARVPWPAEVGDARVVTLGDGQGTGEGSGEVPNLTDVPAPEPGSETIEDELFIYWNLNEAFGTRLDAVGTNHLTSNNSVGMVPGQLNNAASFNGISQWLSIADNGNVSMGDGQAFTITMWLYPVGLVNGATPLNKGQLIFNPNNFEYALEFYTPGGAVPIELLFLTNNGPDLDVHVPVPAGQWNFVVAWYDGGQHIQVNNGLTSNSTYSNGAGASDRTFALNLGSSGSGGAFYPGYLDMVGIWKRALTADERTFLWNGGLGREYPFSL